MTRRHSRFPAVNRDINRGQTSVAVQEAPAPPAPEPEQVEVEEIEVEDLVEEVDETEDDETETDEAPYTAVGGGWYELPDGRRVKGIEKAKAATNQGSATDD